VSTSLRKNPLPGMRKFCATLILLELIQLHHCLHHETMKPEETSSPKGMLAQPVKMIDELSLLRSSRGLEIPLSSTCPLTSACPPCPRNLQGRAFQYVLEEGGAGWIVTCRQIKAEDEVKMERVGSAGVKEGGHRDHLGQDGEMMDFGSDGRVRRESAGGEEGGDFYLRSCAENDLWCSILPHLVSFEAELEELGEGSGQSDEDEDLEGAISFRLTNLPHRTFKSQIVQPSFSSKQNVHERQSWTPFMVILGVFFLAMVGLSSVTSLVLRRLNRGADSKVMRPQCVDQAEENSALVPRSKE